MMQIARFLYHRVRRLVPAWRTRPGGWLPEELLRLVDERGLFIHIPKAAGNSVCQALYGMKIHHRPAGEIRLFHPWRYRRWYKFAVVREPVDRFLSSYDFLSRGGKNSQDAAFRDNFIRNVGDINAFIQRLSNTAFRQKVMRYFHFRPQFYYVCVARRCIVNRLIPFERMNEELPPLLAGASVPFVNVTGGNRTPVSVLSPENLAFVQKLYRIDRTLHQLASSESGKNVYGMILQP